jgi:hypothetical protein
MEEEEEAEELADIELGEGGSSYACIMEGF